MTVFIQKGDTPLSVRQATKRGMSYVASDLALAGARRGEEELLRVIPHENLPASPLCQGSCPLLYFSSISQVGGIGR